jgi:hypothetical protein
MILLTVFTATFGDVPNVFAVSVARPIPSVARTL